MRSLPVLCTVLCAGSVFGGKDATYAEMMTKLDKKNLCPKVFVPGRAGGFVKDEGRQGCCLAGSAASLMQVIYAMHHCKSFQKVSKKQECYYDGLDELIGLTKMCCRDGDEQDDACKAKVAESDKALNEDLRAQSIACMDAKNSGADHKDACHSAVDGAMKAFPIMLRDAGSLYAAGDEADYTHMSRGFIRLCDQLDEGRCLSKVRYIIKHYHLNFAW